MSDPLTMLPPPAAVPPRSSRSVLYFFLGLSVLVAVSAVAAWFLFFRPAVQAATSLTEAAGRALSHITGEKVNISSNTVTLRQSAIAELSTVSRRTQTVTKFESKLLGSTATLILKGDFLIKAGFDLTKPFSIHVDEATGVVTGEFPPAKITSVEMRGYEVFFADQGVWNKLSPTDQEAATKQMIVEARLAAEKSDLKEEAERQLQRRLQDLLGNQAKKVEVAPPAVQP